jgi:hypothetical protein
MPPGRRIIVGYYSTGHSSSGQPSPRYVSRLLQTAAIQPGVDGIMTYTMKAALQPCVAPPLFGPDATAANGSLQLDHQMGCIVQRAYGAMSRANVSLKSDDDGACGNSLFPHSLLNTQCYGHSMQRLPAAVTAADCLAGCCAAEDGCLLWNFADGSHRSGKLNGCWIGTASSSPSRSCVAGRLGWVGGSRAHAPTPPPPGPPPLPRSVPAALDKATPGLEFDGLGAIIDASSRLMYDYPEPQRSEILDFLFKKHFGASLAIAKVEVGGDGQQTDGTTASYRHNIDEPANWNRSHIWWTMREAKKRRQDMRFYGLGWSFPGFIESFYNANATADYLSEWVQGAQTAHGFNVSVLGLWNERQPCTQPNPEDKTRWNCDVIFALRAALDRRGFQDTLIAGVDHQARALAGVVATGAPIGLVATHGPPDLDPEMAAYFRAKGLHFWRSEGEETYSSSGMVATRLVRDFVEYGAQASIAWPIVQGFYPILPWGQYDMCGRDVGRFLSFDGVCDFFLSIFTMSGAGYYDVMTGPPRGQVLRGAYTLVWQLRRAVVRLGVRPSQPVR